MEDSTEKKDVPPSSVSMDENSLDEIEVGIEQNGEPESEKHAAEEADDHIVAQEVTSATTDSSEDSLTTPDGFLFRRAKAMAHRPWLHLLGSLLLALVLSVVAFVAGNFSVAVDNAGWQSRGTLIADRQTQVLLVLVYLDDLFYGGDAVWQNLIDNVQPGWESDDDDRRRMEAVSRTEAIATIQSDSRPFFHMPESFKRRLQDNTTIQGLEGCDVNWYFDGYTDGNEYLWPVWKTRNEVTSALDGAVLRDICEAEAVTQATLEGNGLCFGCQEGCLPPYSLVLFARVALGHTSIDVPCDQLAEEWDAFVQAEDFLSTLEDCVQDLDLNYRSGEPLPTSCPFGFSPTMVDELFGKAGNEVVQYTSSIFATTEDVEALYDHESSFDRAGSSDLVSGTYDTQYEGFINILVDESLISDMGLAMGSAFITGLAILIHTRSCWLTTLGVLQIIFSFPLAFFVYTFFGRVDFFPFLNFIGVFVVFALGADDVFVAVDKWKNARLEHRTATTEAIAAIALPDAAGAMFLTTTTTAVAFFGTAVCPVAPLKCFAIFLGLLIVFDYIMCVALVFPALCIYDQWLVKQNKNCCVSCHFCHRFESHGAATDGEEEQESLIRRILTAIYNVLHKFRWFLLVASVASLVVTIIFALKLDLPTSSDVRILNSGNEFEKNYEWRLKLLYDVLEKRGGSQGYFIWGVLPADTGRLINPESWTQLVLDDDFDPSSEASQEYLRDFCSELFSTEYADLTELDYVCPLNSFDTWLKEQANTTTPLAVYESSCGGASGLPMPQENFNDCIIGWSQEVGEQSVLQRNGVVEIIFIEFQSRVRYDSPFDELDDEWNSLERWTDNMNSRAPQGVNNAYFSSDDFWWYDTNGKMLETAYVAGGIALAAAAVVTLASTRSLAMTAFSIFTIGFILTSVTATLVSIGWTLGFLESVCFAILIGISCDFTIHFGHSYCALPGDVNRHVRSKFALIRMGPSILAAAFTTICSAAIMLFTVITFFQRFATILFCTVVFATIGSFVVFITLAECFGPSRPTSFVDSVIAKIKRCWKTDTTLDDQKHEDAHTDKVHKTPVAEN